MPPSALRGVALGPKNWLFAGADRGGERTATIYSLIDGAPLRAPVGEALQLYADQLIVPVTPGDSAKSAETQESLGRKMITASPHEALFGGRYLSYAIKKMVDALGLEPRTR